MLHFTLNQIEKFLGVTLDKNLDFKSHVNTLCKIAGQKLHALACISNIVDVEKLRVMMNAFVVSQFSYYLLVWMFHDRWVNKQNSRESFENRLQR